MSSNVSDPSMFVFDQPVKPVHVAREYLDEKYFIAVILATLLLHVSGMYVWYLVPNTPMMDIPVRALNIKLGDADDMAPEEVKAVQPGADNKNDVESAISKMVQPQEPEPQLHAKPDYTAASNQATSALDKAIAPASDVVVQETIARQFVRANPVQASGKGTSVVGNGSAKETEMMTRYQQLISLWIKKFQIYPNDARAQEIQGETVIRIRIDRQGNILYYILEHSTGFQVLDRAAIDMVKRANPVPAVPTDYPKGDLIEFLIPVNFVLQ